MTAATHMLGSIFGWQVVANYDDVTMVVSSISIKSAGGRRPVFVQIVSGAQSQQVNTSPGIDSTLLFNPNLTLGNNTVNGKTMLVIVNGSFAMWGT